MNFRTSVFALVVGHLAACSAPQTPEDGKPVAISPFSGSSERRDKSTPIPETSPTPLPKPSSVSLADFEKGSFNGTFLQERCAEGLRESTRIEAKVVARKTELFESGSTACEDAKRVSTTESTWTLLAVKGFEVDLERNKETVTLHREADVLKANENNATDAANASNANSAACVETWEKDKPHGATRPAECVSPQKEHTLLAIEGNALRWGAPGQDAASGELLDGSTEKKRHVKLEDLPYVKSSAAP